MTKARDLANFSASTGVVDADIGSTVQAYDSNLTSFVNTFTLPTSDGTSGQFLQTNGSGALSFSAVSGVLSDYQEFTSSGTWTKPTGATWVYVEAIGGGGGGANDTSTTNVGGGSGGESVFRLLQASELASTVTVTVGAGGAGCANGAFDQGSTGGTTTFGSHLTAYGGNPGKPSSSQMATVPRARSAAISTSIASSLINIPLPQAGFGGYATQAGGSCVYGGAGGGGAGGSALGGTSDFGGNGGDGSATAATKAGNGVQPGGGGGGSNNDGGGGDGADGIVRVWCW